MHCHIAVDNWLGFIEKSSLIAFCGNGFVRYGMQNQWDLERLSHDVSRDCDCYPRILSLEVKS